MYEYQGRIVKYRDGDTVEIDLDLGFKVHLTIPLRLARIDTPEVRTQPSLAKVATDKLKELTENQLVTVQSKGKDRYGRYIAELFVEGKNINDQMMGFGRYE